MDEVSFGPEREARLPPRYRRMLVAVAAGVVTAGSAAGIGLVVTTHHAVSAPPGVSAPAAAPVSSGCPHVQPTWPNVAGLPASMRAGALKVIVDSQFGGRCRVSR
jgi:hypothetical protein